MVKMLRNEDDTKQQLILEHDSDEAIFSANERYLGRHCKNGW
jgi:hypothetical protein